MNSLFRALKASLCGVAPQVLGSDESNESRIRRARSVRVSLDMLDERPSSPRPAPSTPILTPPEDTRDGLRFGVEVEHYGLSFAQVGRIVAGCIAGASVYHDRLIDTPDGRIWRLDEDAEGVEVVTPVLQGADDLQALQRIVHALHAAGGKNSSGEGLHVHIDAAPFTPDKVQNLIALMARHEHWLYPVWNVHAERRDRWSAPIHPRTVDMCTSEPLLTRADLATFWGDNRYMGLNLTNYLDAVPGKNTIEFRYLNGTLDPVAVGCAVGFCQAVTKRALQGDASMAPRRAGLPALLQDLGMDKKHPVAAHLYESLQQRIAQGWFTSKHGPLPNLVALLQDDTFVTNLCALLGETDGNEDVAAAAWQVLHQTPEALAAIPRAADALVRRVRLELMGRYPLPLTIAISLVRRDLQAANVLLPALRSVLFFPCDDDDVARAVAFIGPHLTNGVHLNNALAAVRHLAYHRTGERLLALKDLLDHSPDALQTLCEVLDALPKNVVRAVGRDLEFHQRQGRDIVAIGAALLNAGGLLSAAPRACLQDIIEQRKTAMRARIDSKR